MRATTHELLGGLLSPRFDAFGCERRGSHLDDQERAGCKSCAIESAKPGTTEDSVALEDDRGGVAELSLPALRPWPHTRYFKPGVGLHRTDGPAIESEDVRAWFINGVCHRTDGPALEWKDKYFAWFSEGRLYREDGIAVDSVNATEYRSHGLLHRENGPARLEKPDGDGYHRYGPEPRIDWYINGRIVERAEVWTQWVVAHTPIDAHNDFALDYLDMATNDSDQDAPFGKIFDYSVELALVLHPNIEWALDQPVTPETDPESDTDEQHEPSPKVEADQAHLLALQRLLPPAAQRRALSYDSQSFRRRIAEGERLGTLRTTGTSLSDRWNTWPGVRGTLRVDHIVSADLELDRDMIAFGLPVFKLHRALNERQIPQKVANKEVLTLPERRYWLAYSAHAYARTVALSLPLGDEFPVLDGRLAPDTTIACAIERAFEFAAQAIAAGVDDIVAKSWAQIIITSDGYRRIAFKWDVEAAQDYDRDQVVPAKTHTSDYYAQALDDLRLRGDATRFMDFVSRCYRFSSGAALTDG
jgi:hypothetical protein